MLGIGLVTQTGFGSIPLGKIRCEIGAREKRGQKLGPNTRKLPVRRNPWGHDPALPLRKLDPAGFEASDSVLE